MRKPTLGVSLLEALLTVALVALTMALTAGLVRIYSKSARALDVNSVSIQALRGVLHGVRTELMGAVSFSSPSSLSTWASELTFSKLDPSVTDRLDTFPPGWSPYDLSATPVVNDFLVDIRYLKQGEHLARGVRQASSSVFSFTAVPPDSVEDFSCRLNADSSVELRLIIKGVGRDITYTSTTLRRVP